jgi:hypothetical protein
MVKAKLSTNGGFAPLPALFRENSAYVVTNLARGVKTVEGP